MQTFIVPSPPARRQRGAAALAVAMLLLFGMTLVAFFANRGLLFEQRTSANQYRSTRAFEMADAGLEWAVARLNDSRKMAANSCSPTGTTADTSYRERHLSVTAAGFGALNARSGCSIAANGSTTCGCPAAGAPALGASTDPRFTVDYVAGAGGDPFAVEVRAYGCTSEDPHCNPGSTQRADSIAFVRAVYKMRPTFPSGPGAGLVTGAAAVSGGNLNVINLDVESNGVTINSGTSVDLGTGTSVVTLAGTPPRASVLDNDPSLSSLSAGDPTGDKFFATFFGETIADYKNNPQTYLITGGSCGTNTDRCSTCGNAASCGSAISAAYNKGFQRFWSNADASWSNANLPTAGTLGTPQRPIMVASPESIEMKSNLVAYGMFYCATATVTENWDYSGSGSAKVFGAFVSRGDFVKGSGTLDLIYDANIFKPETTPGLMVRVPGSWRDKQLEY